MCIHEKVQDLPTAIIYDELTLVEHITGKQVVIFTQQLGERCLLLGKGEPRIVDVGLELLRQTSYLLLERRPDLADNLRMVQIIVQPR